MEGNCEMQAGERRGIRQDTRAAIDGIADLIVKPILTAPAEERNGYVAVVGAVAMALAVLYLGSYIVGRMRGWW